MTAARKELTKFGTWAESRALFAVGDSRTVRRLTLETIHDGLRDAEGRLVGGRAAVYQHVQFDGTWCRGQGTPGVITDRWAAHVQATRNGCTYGALAPEHIFDTLEEAQKAALRGLEQQRKRYLKKYGPGRA